MLDFNSFVRPIPIQIEVPLPLIKRSWEWGLNSVDGYAKGEKEYSRQFARPGIDKCPRHQTMGRIGECACCIYLGLSVEELDWGRKCDRKWDFRYRTKLFDAKTSKTWKLLWPVTKNEGEWLENSPADILLGVNGREWFFEDAPHVVLLGWVTRRTFIAQHKVAEAGRPPRNLDPGTKYMEAGELLDVSRLIK